MSILIKGMSKPGKCLDCSMCNSNDDCVLQDERFDTWDEQMRGCPITDVPDTNAGGTISRQAAIDAICKACANGDDYVDCVERRPESTFCDEIVALRKLPPAQPERKTGQWIEISSLHHTYRCSECGRLLVNITDGKNNVVKHYPYCHCGAKMEVKHETD